MDEIKIVFLFLLMSILHKMDSVKAARGQYAGKIWDEKPDMASLLLNATQLNTQLFSALDIERMRGIDRNMNHVLG